jgi:hypothetical protein
MPDDPRKTEHEARVKALREANEAAAKAQQAQPTPTQEENDMAVLGIYPGDKPASPSSPARPAPGEHHPQPAATPRP